MDKQTSSYPFSVGVIALIFSMLSLCIGTSFAKGLFPVLGAQGTSSYRLLFSALLLWCIWRPWRFSLNIGQVKLLLFYGVSLGLMNLLFYMALRSIPLGVAIAIEFCGPLGLALYSSRQKIDILWIGLVIIGLSFLIPFENTTASLDPTGIFYAVCCAFFWASYIIVGQKIKTIHPGQASTVGITIAACVTLPFSLSHLGIEIWQPQLFGLGLLVGILSSALPYSLEMISLRSLDRKTFGVLLSLEPAFGAITASIILQEFLSLSQILAIICIVSASIGCILTANRKLSS